MATTRALSIIAILLAAFALFMGVVCTMGSDRAEQCCDRNRSQVKALRAQVSRNFDQGEKVISLEVESRIQQQKTMDTIVAQLRKAQREVEKIKGDMDEITARQASDRKQLMRAICPGGVFR